MIKINFRIENAQQKARKHTHSTPIFQADRESTSKFSCDRGTPFGRPTLENKLSKI